MPVFWQGDSRCHPVGCLGASTDATPNCIFAFSLTAQTSLSHPPSSVLCLTPAQPSAGDAASVGTINIQSSLLSGFELHISIVCSSSVVGVWHRCRFHREKDGRSRVEPIARIFPALWCSHKQVPVLATHPATQRAMGLNFCPALVKMDSLLNLALPYLRKLSQSNHLMHNKSSSHTGLGIFWFSRGDAISMHTGKPNIPLKYRGELLGKMCCVQRAEGKLNLRKETDRG